MCNEQTAAQSDSDSSDDEDIYSDVYEILSSTTSKVLLMPDDQLPVVDRRVEPSLTSTTGKVEPRSTAATATSSRSRMSIIRVDHDASIQRPPIAPARQRPTVKKYAIGDFNFVKVLGKGSFGKVCPFSTVSASSSA